MPASSARSRSSGSSRGAGTIWSGCTSAGWKRPRWRRTPSSAPACSSGSDRSGPTGAATPRPLRAASGRRSRRAPSSGPRCASCAASMPRAPSGTSCSSWRTPRSRCRCAATSAPSCSPRRPGSGCARWGIPSRRARCSNARSRWFRSSRRRSNVWRASARRRDSRAKQPLVWERLVARTRGGERAAALAAQAALCAGPLADPKRAAELYRRALTDDPRSGAAADGLSRIARDTGQWSLLASLLERRFEAAETPAQRAEIAIEAGRLQLERLASPDLARSWWLRALADAPEDLRVIDGLAELARAQGDDERAPALSRPPHRDRRSSAGFGAAGSRVAALGAGRGQRRRRLARARAAAGAARRAGGRGALRHPHPARPERRSRRPARAPGRVRGRRPGRASGRARRARRAPGGAARRLRRRRPRLPAGLRRRSRRSRRGGRARSPLPQGRGLGGAARPARAGDRRRAGGGADRLRVRARRPAGRAPGPAGRSRARVPDRSRAGSPRRGRLPRAAPARGAARRPGRAAADRARRSRRLHRSRAPRRARARAGAGLRGARPARPRARVGRALGRERPRQPRAAGRVRSPARRARQRRRAGGLPRPAGPAAAGQRARRESTAAGPPPRRAGARSRQHPVSGGGARVRPPRLRVAGGARRAAGTRGAQRRAGARAPQARRRGAAAAARRLPRRARASARGADRRPGRGDRRAPAARRLRRRAGRQRGRGWSSSSRRPAATTSSPRTCWRRAPRPSGRQPRGAAPGSAPRAAPAGSARASRRRRRALSRRAGGGTADATKRATGWRRRCWRRAISRGSPRGCRNAPRTRPIRGPARCSRSTRPPCSSSSRTGSRTRGARSSGRSRAIPRRRSATRLASGWRACWSGSATPRRCARCSRHRSPTPRRPPPPRCTSGWDGSVASDSRTRAPRSTTSKPPRGCFRDGPRPGARSPSCTARPGAAASCSRPWRRSSPRDPIGSGRSDCAAGPPRCSRAHPTAPSACAATGSASSSWTPATPRPPTTCSRTGRARATRAPWSSCSRGGSRPRTRRPRDARGEWSAQRASLRLRIAGLRATRLADPDGAIAMLEPALGELGAQAAIAEPLADLYERAGYSDDLIELCQRAAAESSDAGERGGWHLRRGAALRELRRDPEAAEAFREVLTDRPGDREAEAALCELYRRMGEHEPLARLLETELTRPATPAEATIRLELAELLAGPLARPAEALPQLRRVLQLEPGQPEAQAAALEIAERLGQDDLLLELLDGALAHASPPPLRAGRLLLRARLLTQTRPADAERDLREALTLDPTLASARAARLALLERLSRWPELLAAIERETLAADAGARAELLERGAAIAWQRISPDAALPWLARLRSERPHDASLPERCAEAHRLAGRAEARLRALGEQLALLTDPAQRRALLLERARVLERDLASPGRAVAELTTLWRVDAKDVLVLRELERLHRDLGRPRERVRMLESLLRAHRRERARAAPVRGRGALVGSAARAAKGGGAPAPGRRRDAPRQRSARRAAARAGRSAARGRPAPGVGPLRGGRAARPRPGGAGLRGPPPGARSLPGTRLRARAAPARPGAPPPAVPGRRSRLPGTLPPESLREIEEALLRLLRAHAGPVELESHLAARLARGPASAEGWLELARLRDEKLHASAAAADAYRRALELDPESLAALRGLRGAAERLGAWSEVAETLEREVEQETNAPADHRAALLRRLGDLSWQRLQSTTQASRSYAAALEADPRDFEALRALERLLEAMEDWRGALDLYESEVEMLGESDGARRQQACLRAGAIARDRTGEPARALRAYLQAASLGSLAPAQTAELAELHLRCGDAAAFASVFASWCDESGSGAGAADHLRLAEALEAQNRPAEALSWAERSLAGDGAPAGGLAARGPRARGGRRRCRAQPRPGRAPPSSATAATRRMRGCERPSCAGRRTRRRPWHGWSAPPASTAARPPCKPLSPRRARRAAIPPARWSPPSSRSICWRPPARARSAARPHGSARAARSRSGAWRPRCVASASCSSTRPADREAQAGLGEACFGLGDLTAARRHLEACLAGAEPNPRRSLQLVWLGRCLEAGSRNRRGAGSLPGGARARSRERRGLRAGRLAARTRRAFRAGDRGARELGGADRGRRYARRLPAARGRNRAARRAARRRRGAAPARRARGRLVLRARLGPADEPAVGVGTRRRSARGRRPRAAEHPRGARACGAGGAARARAGTPRKARSGGRGFRPRRGGRPALRRGGRLRRAAAARAGTMARGGRRARGLRRAPPGRRSGGPGGRVRSARPPARGPARGSRRRDPRLPPGAHARAGTRRRRAPPSRSCSAIGPPTGPKRSRSTAPRSRPIPRWRPRCARCCGSPREAGGPRPLRTAARSCARSVPSAPPSRRRRRPRSRARSPPARSSTTRWPRRCASSHSRRRRRSPRRSIPRRGSRPRPRAARWRRSAPPRSRRRAGSPPRPCCRSPRSNRARCWSSSRSWCSTPTWSAAEVSS